MQKDFKSFKTTYKVEEETPSKPAVNANLNEMGKDDIEKFAKKYDGKNENDIMSDILKTANKSKEEGTLDINYIEKFANNLAPNLNDEQRNKLNDVLKMIKNQ